MSSIARRTIHLYSGEIRDIAIAAMLSPDEGRAAITAFEDTFARHIGVRHAIAVGSGRLGLRFIFEALGVGRGDGVLLPAYTDQSVPQTIRKVGAEPRFVDVERRHHNLDPSALEARIDSRSKVVIATHLFGSPSDMESIGKIADKHGLLVLEDCAHAVDSTSRGQMCGSIGRAAIFSFVVTKAINTFGGGMVTTNDSDLALAIRKQVAALPGPSSSALARRIGVGYAINKTTSSAAFGLMGAPLLKAVYTAGVDPIALYNRFVRAGTVNANRDVAFTPLQAAAGLQQVRELDKTQRRRKEIAQRFIDACPNSIRPQGYGSKDGHSWYFFIVTCESPDALVQHMLSHGIDVGRFPMRNCADLDSSRPPGEFPNTDYLYEHSVQLPAYATLLDAEVHRIEKAIASYRG